MITRLTVAAALLVASSHALAIYQCTDEHGSKTFQDSPCSSTPKSVGKSSPSVTLNNSLTHLDETLIRTLYQEQANAMAKGDLKWLCNIMSDRFNSSIKISGIQASPTIAYRGKKQENCRDYRAMFANFNENNRQWQYKIDINSITLNPDNTQAVVKSSYHFTVNQLGASAKGSSTDTWGLKDGHVYLMEVKGEATSF